MIQIETVYFTVAKKELMKLLYQCHFLNRWYCFFFIYFLLFLYHMVLVFSGFGKNLYLNVFIAIMYSIPLVTLFLSYYFIARFVNSSASDLLLAGKSLHFSETDILLYFQNGKVSSIKTEEIKKVAQTKGFLLLFVSKNVFLPVPKNAFQREELQQLLEFFKTIVDVCVMK